MSGQWREWLDERSVSIRFWYLGIGYAIRPGYNCFCMYSSNFVIVEWCPECLEDM